MNVAELANLEMEYPVEVVDGDVFADIRVLEDRRRFIAVLQGGLIKVGRMA